MSLYSWEVIVMLAELKSVTRTAELLNLSPSAISHMVKKTETDLGYPLFIREGNLFELTDKAQRLYPYILNYTRSGKALREEAGRLLSSMEGTVRIASYNAVIKQWLPGILSSFHEKYPDIKVVIRQENDVAIKEMMDRGETDLAIVLNEYYHSDTFIPLHNTKIVCFGPSSYVPPGGTYMTDRDLRDMPVILRSGDYDETVNRILRKAGVSLDSEFRIDGDEACYEFIKQGFGFRITAEITYEVKNGEVSKYPLKDAPMRTLGIITPFPKYISPSAKLFREEVIGYVKARGLYNV